MKKTQKRIDLVEVILNNKTLVILVLLCALAGILSENFFQTRNLLNIVRQVCVSCVIGVGFTFILASGNMDLSVGYLLGMIGVIMGQLSRAQVAPVWVIMLIGILVGVLAELFNGALITFFRLQGFIVTLATGQIFCGIDYIVCNTTTISGLQSGFKVVGQAYFLGIPVPVYIMIAVAVILAVVLNKTAFGRHVIAMGGNAQAARVCGISIEKTRLLIFAIMGACTGIASVILTGHTFTAQPNAGHGMEMDAIAAVVIGGTSLSGGTGKISGTIFGCLLVGVINNILNLTGVDSNWQLIAKGAMIIVAIFIDEQSSSIMAKHRNR